MSGNEIHALKSLCLFRLESGGAKPSPHASLCCQDSVEDNVNYFWILRSVVKVSLADTAGINTVHP